MQIPGKLALQRCTTVQVPKIDLAQTIDGGTASPLFSKLRSLKKRKGDNRGTSQDCFGCMLDFVLCCCLIVDDWSL